MTRIRSTWTSRRADDPRAMNQDHLSQQPSADQYDIGGPSEFAEDVAPTNWKGDTRNEIGMPNIRPESMKQAADFDTLTQRASICLKLASKVLGKNASEAMLEDQAVAFMNLGPSGVISTLGRIAAAQAEQDDEDEDEGDDQGQSKQAQDEQCEDEGQDKQAQDQSQEDEGQEKQAGEMPPQFKENAEKKKEEAAEAKEDKKASTVLAQQQQVAQQVQQLAQQIQALQQQLAQQPVDQLVDQQIQQVAQQAPVAQQQAQQIAQQQQVQQLAQQQQQAQQQQLAQDDMFALDQMLAQDDQVPPMGDDDIELFGGSFDTEEAQLGDDDQALASIFASGQEAQDALASQQGCVTASTRTVGTRPTAGVSRIASASTRGSTESLSNLWGAPPDVSDVFR